MAKNSPSVRLRRLGAQLRRLREGAGLTLDEAAELVQHSRSALARIENAQVVARPHDVDYILIRYGVRDDHIRRALLALAAAGRKKGWARKHADILRPESIDYIGLETDATSIRVFDALHLPGLLQTEAYARAAIGGVPVSSSVERHTEIRMTRQAVLDRADPPALRAVIAEGALRQVVGGPEVMRGQLARLLDASRLPNIALHVLPFEAGGHAGVDGPFTILEVAGQLTVVLIEGLTSAWYLEGDDEICRYNLVFDHLRAAALSEADTRALIERMAGEL